MGFIVTLLCLISLCQAIAVTCLIESIFQFGASKSDTGNAILLPYGSYLPSNRLPYGETFPGKPTGRWSDGRLVIDITAEAFHLPSLNPYLNTSASFKNGVNFAVGGATALNSTALLLHGIVNSQVPGLEVQISWFSTYLNSICATPSECSKVLQNSLIFFGEIGGNDINYAIIQGKSYEQIYALIPSIVNAVLNGIEELIAKGASKFVVPGNYPIGCLSFVVKHYRRIKYTTYDENGCVKRTNELVKRQNQLLQFGLRKLSAKYPNVKLTYLDFYGAIGNIISHPQIHGFHPSTVLESCCGFGEFNTSDPQFCGGTAASICEDPNQYINWDGIHLTEAVNKLIFKSLAAHILTN